MLYHSFPEGFLEAEGIIEERPEGRPEGTPEGKNTFNPPDLARVDTALLIRSLAEYRQSLALLAVCDSDHARAMQRWMRDAVTCLQDELERRGEPAPAYFSDLEAVLP